MRWFLVAVVLFAGMASSPAVAYENFITSGHSYTPENIPLPPINSSEAQFTQQTDIYQADIYVKERQRKILDSQIQRFFDGPNPGIPSDDIQY